MCVSVYSLGLCFFWTPDSPTISPTLSYKRTLEDVEGMCKWAASEIMRAAAVGIEKEEDFLYFCIFGLRHHHDNHTERTPEIPFSHLGQS